MLSLPLSMYLSGHPAQQSLIPPAMGAIHLAIFILTSLRAVGGFAQTPHKPSESLVAHQALALQERNTGPALAQVSPKADDSPYRDPPDETQSIALPSWSSVETISKPDLILSSNALCSSVNHPTTTTGGKLKRRGVKQRRGATPNPELFCPLPAAITTTDTDTGPSKIDGQRPQTEKGQEQGPTPPDGLPQPEEFKWPNLFKIPTDDGDSPACFEATNGLMPVGVCENPEQRPEPSRWDVFMQFNRYFNPRAWKLLDSTLGAFFFFLCLFPRQSRSFNFSSELDKFNFFDISFYNFRPLFTPRSIPKNFHFRPIFLLLFNICF